MQATVLVDVGGGDVTVVFFYFLQPSKGVIASCLFLLGWEDGGGEV